MRSISHAELAPGWALIQVNFDPIQEIGPKIGAEHFVEGGCSFMRLRYYQTVFLGDNLLVV